MILNVLLDALVGLMTTIFGAVLPTAGSIPLTIPALGPVLFGFTWLNSMIPLAEAIQGFGLIIIVWGVVWAIRLVVWIWGQIPVIGGSG